MGVAKKKVVPAFVHEPGKPIAEEDYQQQVQETPSH
jgi:hypothetical protein